MKPDSFDIRGYAPDVDPMDDSLPNDDERRRRFMRHKPRRFTAALLVFCLFFQLLPFPALAGGGRRSLIRAPEPTTAGALRASLKRDASSSQSGSIQPLPPIRPIRTAAGYFPL